MAIYAIGDVQGCFLTLKKLLEHIDFNEENDEIIFLGDVINRGPRSLEVLKFIKDRQPKLRMVLGNHEIFAIALALNAIKPNRPHTLEGILHAPDKDALIEFLRCQPLLIERDKAIFLHAGILPCHSLETAKMSATLLSDVLKSKKATRFLKRFYEKIPTSHRKRVSAKRELRLTLAYLTMIRMCSSKNAMDLTYNGSLEKAPKTLKPWFDLREDQDLKFYFGHWAGLGLYQKNNYYCLDSGCYWGNKLTALRLLDHKIFQVVNCED